MAGKLNGVIPAVTPSGILYVCVSMSFAIPGNVSPSCSDVILQQCSTTSVVITERHDVLKPLCWHSFCVCVWGGVVPSWKLLQICFQVSLSFLHFNRGRVGSGLMVGTKLHVLPCEIQSQGHTEVYHTVCRFPRTVDDRGWTFWCGGRGHFVFTQLQNVPIIQFWHLRSPLITSPSASTRVLPCSAVMLAAIRF